MIDFIGNKKYFFAFSILITVIGLISLLVRGLPTDIEFSGGTEIQVNLGKTLSVTEIAKIDEVVKATTGMKEVSVQTMGTNQDQASIRTLLLNEAQVSAVNAELQKEFGLSASPEISHSNVSPSIGDELKQKGLTAIIIAALCLLGYVAIRFSAMSGLSAGTTAIIALVHDLFIMVSVYSIFQIPVNGSFIAAVLTILGYSVNDTIVVYDRIRENQGLMRKSSVTELVNASINQTLARSINTVVTVLISVAVLYVLGLVFGLKAIQQFTFPLLIGITSGCYSSVCIASPLWVLWREGASVKKVAA